MPVIVGEQKYFTAEEARIVSDEQRKSIITKEIDSIYKEIDKARWDGDRCIYLKDTCLQDETMVFLKNKGFKIKFDPYNDIKFFW